MSDFDIVAFSDGTKGLIVCFIITILLANFYLIYVTVRKGGFFYRAKSLTMISMAIGDIFLALFPLIVLARAIFEGPELSLPCSTTRASTVYLKFLIHFVYGFGLITLAVELVHRYKTQQKQEKTTRNIIQSVIYSAVPWLLGLIVVLPVTLANLRGPYSDAEQPGPYAILTPFLLRCFDGLTKKKGLSMYGVCVLLPAPLAVVVCIIMMCIRILPAYYTAPAVVTYPNQAQTMIVTSQNTNTGNAISPQYPVSNAVGVQQYPISNPQGVQQYPYASPQGPQQYPIANPQGTQLYPANGVMETAQIPTAPSNDKHNPNLGESVPTPPATQYPVQQYPPPAYPAQEYLPPQYPPPQYVLQQYPPPYYAVGQQYTTQSNVIVAAPAYIVQAGPTLADPGREKNALLVVSIVHAICVIPFAIFSMGSLDSNYSYETVSIIIDATFFWLAVFRSLITPLIFIRFNKGLKN
ncbi:unnamed protein product [Candidula unifasciata]|uniref:G-protein coupled receptors family 1 profile domain-containing protein n=1 Tax=Candidula unifasciata TaxID=100452 RepID=A0A8S3YLN3_9EUPU|nr:unnamed protein product [Candidula unifasciata]